MNDFPEKGSTVVVAMSGGVDSTLVAMLLKEHGCKVIGATMSLWNNDLPIEPNQEGLRNSCYGPDESIDIETCRKFCEENGFDHYTIDVREAYRKEVLEYFKAEYRNGHTPNPCIMCNPIVKFGAFVDGIKAKGIEFDYFCTGHYAKLVRPSSPLVPGWNNAVMQNGKEVFPLLIANADDSTKDQTYFLYRIPSETLEKVCFPLGTFTKKQVFELARERHLKAAEKAESQDFLPQEYVELLFADRPPVEGDIVDVDGKVLGRHRGIEFYTIGQRRGLGVSAPTPLYVHSIDAEHNRIVLDTNDSLLADGLYASNFVWPNNIAPEQPFSANVKIRLATPQIHALIEPCPDEGEGIYKVIFDNPARAVAPGQSVVIYIEGMIVGGGIITRGIPHE